jgi:pyridoxine kinase
VALPIISAAGIEVDVLPTAVLSSQTGGFTDYTVHDMTSEMKKITAHWTRLGLKFDAVYSGYLASEKQVGLVRKILTDFLEPDGKFFLDPVMGDAGVLYPGFSETYPAAMKELALSADYIFPNFTEACLLTGTEYGKIGAGDYDGILRNLQEICPRSVVTGIPNGGMVGTGWIENGVAGYVFSPELPGFFHGAGDVFSSVMTASLLCGKSFSESVEFSAEFTERAVKRTAASGADTRFGLEFEKDLKWIVKSLSTL